VELTSVDEQLESNRARGKRRESHGLARHVPAGGKRPSQNSSSTLRRIASMKLAEVPGRLKADQQCTHRKHEDIARRSHVKVSNTQHERVPDDRVEKSPQSVDS
jgi:hypothetical protein